MDGDITDSEVTLSDLLDAASINEVGEHLQRTFGLGIVVYSQKKVLRDTCSENGPLSKWTKKPAGKKAWQKFIDDLGKLQLKRHEFTEKKLASGLRFLITPIVHELDVIGICTVGPYLHSNEKLSPSVLKELGSDGKSGAKAQSRIPRLGAEEMENLTRFFGAIFELLAFSAYKRVLTNSTHLSSMAENYRQLEKTNHELQRSYEQLRDIDKMKSNFLAMVSHELRTPLTSVIGYSEMLLEGIAGGLNESQEKYLKIILEKADQLLKLIKQILNLSKIEAGKMKLVLEDSSLKEIVDLALENARPSAEKRNLKFVRSMGDANLPKTIALDRDKINQVYSNLLSNAIKFNVEDGAIEVTLKAVKAPQLRKMLDAEEFAGPNKDWLLCSVKDSGIGIPKEMVSRIFERFFQIDSSSTREFGGTGLGLSIAKSFVEMHGGRLWAESEENKGTEVFFALPVRHVS